MELDQPLWQLLPGSAHLGLAVAPFHLGQGVIAQQQQLLVIAWPAVQVSACVHSLFVPILSVML
jgi:hypothetical protein